MYPRFEFYKMLKSSKLWNMRQDSVVLPQAALPDVAGKQHAGSSQILDEPLLVKHWKYYLKHTNVAFGAIQGIHNSYFQVPNLSGVLRLLYSQWRLQRI